MRLLVRIPFEVKGMFVLFVDVACHEVEERYGFRAVLLSKDSSLRAMKYGFREVELTLIYVEVPTHLENVLGPCVDLMIY